METNEKAVSVEIKNDVSMKKNNKGIIIGIILATLIAFVIGIIIYNGSDNDVSEQLDLGHKYLEEQDYEQAIVVFNKAIEIDNECPEAYVGLAETYIRMGEYDMALEVAQKGYEITGDENLAEYIKMLESGNVSRSDGKIMKRTVYDGNGNVLFYHEFTYDKQGREASITHYNSEHVFVSTIDFLYDEQGKILIWCGSHSVPSGELIKEEISYNENGLRESIIVTNYENNRESWVFYEYDEMGREIKVTQGNGTNIMQEMTCYDCYYYDNEGNVICEERYHYNSSVWELNWQYIREYQNGKEIRVSFYQGDGTLLHYQTREWKDDKNIKYSQYDGEGNLEWETIFDDGGTRQYNADGKLIYEKRYDAEGNVEEFYHDK